MPPPPYGLPALVSQGCPTGGTPDIPSFFASANRIESESSDALIKLEFGGRGGGGGGGLPVIRVDEELDEDGEEVLEVELDTVDSAPLLDKPAGKEVSFDSTSLDSTVPLVFGSAVFTVETRGAGGEPAFIFACIIPCLDEA